MSNTFKKRVRCDPMLDGKLCMLLIIEKISRFVYISALAMYKLRTWGVVFTACVICL